jgi:hypothetical protein
MFGANRSIFWLTLFAVAMANVEAVLVIHLRTIYYPDNPLVIFPLNLMSHRDLFIELGREVTTVAMILAVALLAARAFTPVFAAFVYVFGLWDVFYYVWLKLLIGWPSSWLEWDVLFLIPWPWFGPWLTPVLIALLFVIWGGWTLLMTQRGRDARFTPTTLVLFLVGTALALTAFLLPAVPLLPGGEEAFPGYQPGGFSWGLYAAGYILMASSLWIVARSAVTAHRPR